MGELENVAIKKENKELEKLKAKFKADSQKKDSNQAELKILIEKIQLKDRDLKKLVDDAKKKIESRASEHLVDIRTKADPILKDIARKGGYSVIFTDRSALAYLDPGVDVTEEVIKKLDKMK
jgi:Skp family chaperone for outer membrane proteins